MNAVPAALVFLCRKLSAWVMRWLFFYSSRDKKNLTRRQKKRKGFITPLCLRVCKTMGKRAAVYALLLWTSVAAVLYTANTQAGEQAVYSIKLPAQSVATALTALSEQTDQMLLFPYDVAEALRANPVAGRYTLQQALDIMLAGTGYSGGLTQKGVLMISLKPSNTSGQYTEGISMNSKKKLLAATVGFFMGAGGASYALAKEVQGGEGLEWVLEEIVVTAQKRKQSIQDAAMSISAIGGEEIGRKSVVGMTDYLRFVPNVSTLELGPGWDQVIIRGVGISLGEQSTVSTYFGEVPLTSSSRIGFSTDMKLVDIERVEVLRGPQGTLYGSGALGGTVRNIPNPVKLEEFEGKLEMGYGLTSGSDDSNNKLIGILNFPIIDNVVGLRMSGYRFDNAGYIDLVSTPDKEDLAEESDTRVAAGKDVGGHTYTGGRANLLWQPNDNLSASLLYAVQEVEEDGNLDVNLDLGGYRFSKIALPDTAAGDERGDKFDFANLVLEYDLVWGNILASLTRYDGEASHLYAVDRWISFAAAQDLNQIEKEADVYEVRLVSDLDSSFQFLSGIYYEDFKLTQKILSQWIGNSSSFDAAGLGDDPFFFRANRNSELTQKAIFGELIYELSSQWEVTLGGRWYDYERRDIDSVAFAGPAVEANLPTNEDGTNYKANITWAPTEDTMFYAQWAEGFRLGEGQVLPPESACDIDGDGILDGTNGKLVDRLESDTTTNYELGSKLKLLDDRLTLNTSIYHIDWNDIPVTITSPIDGLCAGRIIKNNVGEARSQGVELEMHYNVVPNLQVSFSAGYADTEYLNEGVGTKGDRLPLTPEWNGTLGIEYYLNFGEHQAFIRTDYSYRDDVTVGVSGNAVDSYGKWDLRSGIAIDAVSIEAYVTNLTNDDAVASRWEIGSNGFRLKPRTIGLDVSYSF